MIKIQHIKFQILFCIVYSIILYSLFIPLACWCYEPVQTVTITKEDIMNAKPSSPYKVQFSEKERHIIEVMEKRHFPRTYPEFDDAMRLKNLEYELLGRIWEYTPKETRIKKLKIASSNTMLIGTALPPSISSRRNARRMRNDSIQLRERDNVGLIDGFLRLINPEKYEEYRKYSEELHKKYDQEY